MAQQQCYDEKEIFPGTHKLFSHNLNPLKSNNSIYICLSTGHRKSFALTGRSRWWGPDAVPVVLNFVIRRLSSLDRLLVTVIKAIPPEEGETDSDERGERL